MMASMLRRPGLPLLVLALLAAVPATAPAGTTAASARAGATSAGAAAAPTRLASRPALRRYACLHQSQGYTGFAEPTVRFTLKAGGKWVDRSFAKPITAKWTWRKRVATLYSKKGRRLYRFAHWKDSRGRYLVETPRGSDPLICR